MLANYAVSDDSLTERIYPEVSEARRSPFQRDRDRVVHSKSFRRLEYKTQVFVNHLGDNYRTRLTHSIEVTQIARTVSRFLNLNEDLTEVIALAHDIGHPPFGHAGERILNELLEGNGGFDHNLQTIKTLELLEERYPSHPGLNLTHATLLGLQKHQHKPGGMSHSLEAQVVDICDEIAYINHDIEDGLEARYLDLEELGQNPLWNNTHQATIRAYPENRRSIQIRYSVRNLIKMMVNDLIDTTLKNIKHWQIETLDDVLNFHKNEDIRKPRYVVGFSPILQEQVLSLKKFLFRKLYRHPQVLEMNIRGTLIIERLFHYFCQHKQLLPEDFLKRESSQGLQICVADFIAGMTDRYAIQWNNKVLGVADK